MKITTARQRHQASPWLKVSIYGPSGSGKTTWAARSPRPLIAVTEPQAIPSISHANPDALVVEVSDFEDFRELLNGLTVAPQIEIDGQPALSVDGHAVQTLVLDSGTDLQDLAIMRQLGAKRGEIDRLDFEAEAASLSLQQWGQNIDAMISIWRQQRALQCNTVFIHLADIVLDNNNRRLVTPSLKGKKLPFQIGQYFNAQGVAMVSRQQDTVASQKRGTGNAKHAIRWVADSTRYVCKPAPGWPTAILNTPEAGQTTLGSLSLFSAPPGLVVPHVSGDSAEWVSAQTRQAESLNSDEFVSEPGVADKSPTPSPESARRRRR